MALETTLWALAPAIFQQIIEQVYTTEWNYQRYIVCYMDDIY